MYSKLQKLEAIVLGSSMYGDSDKIVTFFTREKGKVRGIAKGVKKLTSKKRPSLEPFTHIKMQMTDSKSGLGIITEASTINTFLNIRQDITSVSVAYFLCESIQKSLADGVPHEEVFSLLLYSLNSLNEGGSRKEIKEDFTKELLMSLGYVEDAETLADPLKVFEEVVERKLGSVRVGKLIQ